jgi:RND family efflux transporter MFP subunit
MSTAILPPPDEQQREEESIVIERTTSNKKMGGVRWVAGTVVLLLVLAAGVLPRIERNKRAVTHAATATNEVPLLPVVKARVSSDASDVVLPGNSEAVTVAKIYARASGYVRSRFVDIGSTVRAGQVLAVIEAPELDQEVAQAQANLAQARAALEQVKANVQQSRAAVVQARANVEAARANEEIAGTTSQRWNQLVAKGVLPRQSGDERRSAFAARQAETAATDAGLHTAEASVRAQEANVKAAEATVIAQQANVARLQRLQGFTRVVAPFDGVITERNIEQGDLVSAGAAGGDRGLFSIAQSATLRIQIDVPQTYAADIKPGMEAQVLVRERPHETFRGTVARIASALDQGSRTMRVEIQTPNSGGALLPGMYLQVKFALPRSRPTVLIPAEALVANANGTRVASVGADQKVRYLPVVVGRDLGTEIEVLDGLKGTESLLPNPGDAIREGQQVRTTEQGKRS